MSITIRAAVSEDAAALSIIGQATFTRAFGHLYPKPDLDAFLRTHHSQPAYAAILAHETTQIWLVEDDGETVGYAQIGPNSLPCDPPLADAIELKRLYLMPGYQGQGIGARLMDKALSHARTAGAQDMVISVYSENHGALRFYAHYGFENIGTYEFLVGQQRDAEFILHRCLRP